MSESKQQDIRRIEDVTDDEIVDQIAQCGLDGMNCEDPYEGNAIEQTCRNLRLMNDESDSDANETAEMVLMERIDELEKQGRLSNPNGDFIYLTPREWARRLVGRSESTIASLLAGEDPRATFYPVVDVSQPQPPADDLTDDEIHRAAFGSS